jgi:hypothetical protein
MITKTMVNRILMNINDDIFKISGMVNFFPVKRPFEQTSMPLIFNVIVFCISIKVMGKVKMGLGS